MEHTKNQPSVKEFQPHLLFLHAWSGCDTTSATFNKGKSCVLKTFKKFPAVKTLASIITDDQSNQNQVGDASAQMFKLMYGYTTDDTLAKIR